MQSSLEFPLQETMLQFHRRKLIGTHLLYAGGTSLGTRITAGNSRRSSTLWSSRHLCQYFHSHPPPSSVTAYGKAWIYIYIYTSENTAAKKDFQWCHIQTSPYYGTLFAPEKRELSLMGISWGLWIQQMKDQKHPFAKTLTFYKTCKSRSNRHWVFVWYLKVVVHTHESDDLSTSTPVGKQSYRQRRHRNWMSTSSLLHHPWMWCLTQISFFYVPSFCLHSMMHRLNREYTSHCNNLREKSQCSWRVGYFQ